MNIPLTALIESVLKTYFTTTDVELEYLEQKQLSLRTHLVLIHCIEVPQGKTSGTLGLFGV